MGARSSMGSPTRWIAGLVVIGALWLVAFQHHDRIPGLTYVNLGLHEFGHMVTYSASDLINALMGSIAQVAIPLLIALWLFFRRGDWVAAGVCLAWAATSALEVAIYVADAPTQELELIGDSHDWAFILGPDGYDAMDKSASLANTIRDGASVAAAIGFVLCLAAPLKARNRRQPEETAFTRREMPASSPWAESATSGKAPRSASSPK
jgi:hypothetical protein